jgi:hypothetical protein
MAKAAAGVRITEAFNVENFAKTYFGSKEFAAKTTNRRNGQFEENFKSLDDKISIGICPYFLIQHCLKCRQ